MSTQHVVSRTVRDSALLLDIASGPDVGDPYAAPYQAAPFLEAAALEPGQLRIAWTTDTFNGSPTDPQCRDAVERTAAVLEELGHQVEQARPDVDAEVIAVATRCIIGANIKAAIEDRARELGREPTADDVEPLTWATAQGASERSAVDYVRAVKTIHSIGRTVASFLARFDMLLSPTMACPPMKIGELALTHPQPEVYIANVLQTVGYTQLMNASGNPAISLPLHWSDDELPIGVQFAAGMGGEARLLSLASQLETARPWRDRRPPIWG